MASVIGQGLRGLTTSAENRTVEDARERNSVLDLIERAIIPRIIAANLRARPAPIGSKGKIKPGDIERFAPMTLSLEVDALMDEVDGFMDHGVSVDQLLLHLLAPTARKLGEYWEDDSVDFVEVTMGLWRLQQVMREVASRRSPVITGLAASRRAFFSPIPGDQHHFGTMMVEEFFANAGWDTDIFLETDRRGLLERLAAKPFDIAGLTISNDCNTETLASLLKAMRSVSKNPNMRILIGGRAVLENSKLVADTGADGTAQDPRDALHRAEELVKALLPQQSLTH